MRCKSFRFQGHIRGVKNGKKILGIKENLFLQSTELQKIVFISKVTLFPDFEILISPCIERKVKGVH
jgi:hypothetical protein